jgi:UDP-N-acetyl-D-mannosaminuronic acid transferase (WecB/TagA/CpsF family)
MATATVDDETRQSPALNRPLFGFDFENEHDLSSIVERVLGPQPADDRLPFVVTPNVDYIVRLREPGLADLAKALPRARYVLPDGQPIVWTSRLVKPSLKSRLPRSSMFPVVWKRVVADQRRALIVAATRRPPRSSGASCLMWASSCHRTSTPPTAGSWVRSSRTASR